MGASVATWRAASNGLTTARIRAILDLGVFRRLDAARFGDFSSAELVHLIKSAQGHFHQTTCFNSVSPWCCYYSPIPEKPNIEVSFRRSSFLGVA
jgi:hypothetical protein